VSQSQKLADVIERCPLCPRRSGKDFESAQVPKALSANGNRLRFQLGFGGVEIDCLNDDVWWVVRM